MSKGQFAICIGWLCFSALRWVQMAIKKIKKEEP